MFSNCAGHILIFPALACGAWFWRECQRGWTEARLERSIAAEIELGCGRKQVETWFNTHGIRYQYFSDTTGDRVGASTMPMLAGLNDSSLGGMLRRWIDGPEANVGFFELGYIQIFFFFDHAGTCVGHLVRPFIYSF